MASNKKGTIAAYDLLVSLAKEYEEKYPNAFVGEDEPGVITFTEIHKRGVFNVTQTVCIQVEESR